MQIPTKKLKSGFEIPVFGIGTWRMGGGEEFAPHHDPANDDEADIRAIEAAIEMGVSHIDTAELYAEGYAEMLVGKAIKKFDREKLFIASKARGDHKKLDDIRRACEASLRRLDTTYLNLYLIHWFPEHLPLTDFIRVFDKLVRDRLIRYIGVSNFTLEHVRDAQKLSENKIVCNQVHYNLMFREPERKGLLKYCQENDVILVAWRPVEKGELTRDVPPLTREMCMKYQKLPAQVAINWLISQPNIVTIAKSRSLEHLKENLGAVGWNMEHDDIEKLRDEFPGQRDVSDIVPLE